MAFHIKDPQTDALARKVAALKKVSLNEAVHVALAHELEASRLWSNSASSSAGICARGAIRRKTNRPAFRDSLY
jgi:antitoxin VapB